MDFIPTLPEHDTVLLDRKKALVAVEILLKKYNIPKENIVADRSTLRWLFVSKSN